MAHPDSSDVPTFDRRFLRSGAPFMRIGDGELGGKGRRLLEILPDLKGLRDGVSGLRVDVPQTLVLTTEPFDRFIRHNGLAGIGTTGLPDDRIVRAFLDGDLPTEVLGDLRALMEEVKAPLAVRSSSLLEDSRERPFAGVYGTKMIPNNQPDADTRFRALVEAIKFVFASTYFRQARAYRAAADCPEDTEKMAVLIQEVVGRRHDERFYPDISGVGRTFNYYPFGGARPEDGQVTLALGLGKTIVDGERAWSYSPARPHSPPPFASVEERLQNTQLTFWAINMGRAPEYDPTAETEYLAQCGLQLADYDGTLPSIASTYDASSDRLVAGTGPRGARVVDFAPILVLERFPINHAIRAVMTRCESRLGPVEIEFAVTLPKEGQESDVRLTLLQVRPMLVSDAPVELSDADLEREPALAIAQHAMGHGMRSDIRDVVYVKPDAFASTRTHAMAGELEEMNRTLTREGRRYLLIGFGRWGTSDPSLGIPVQWEQISGAAVVVEASLPGFVIEPSQGSHFFHNLSSFEVLYLLVRHDQRRSIDWTALNAHAAVNETETLRHVRLAEPLDVRVDGRSGRGGIWWHVTDGRHGREGEA